MKIAILGTGQVGSNLAKTWIRSDHDIMFGTRDPNGDRVKNLVRELDGKADAAPIADAITFAKVIVLTVPWNAVPTTIETAGDLTGKVLIDATNAVVWDNGPVIGVEGSAGEQVAELAQGASVVKAFNTIGVEHLVDPQFGDLKADMFICGDDPEAKQIVGSLVEDAGFEVQDAGPLRNARLLESLGLLWIHMATIGGQGRNTAFKLLHK